jgi:type IV pilus assembly protein PilY1
MKKSIIFLAMVLLTPQLVYSAPDYYLGDTSVYAGSTASVPPNIMLLFDVSPSMTTAGSAIKYDSSVAYDATKGYIPKYKSLSGKNSIYTSQAIYTMNSETSGKFNATKFTIKADDAGGQIKYIQCEEAREALYDNGVWSKAGWELNKDGNCVQSKNTNQSTTYYTGDNACLQYELSTIAQSPWTANTIYSIGDVVEALVNGTLAKFVCSAGGTSGATAPAWNLSDITHDNTVEWKPAESALTVAVDVLKNIANSLGSRVRLGAAAIGDDANKGATIYQPLIQPDTEQKLTTFNNSMVQLRDQARTEGNHQPVNEGLWDVGTYYSGDFDFIAKNEITDPASAEYWCQPNHIIVVTSDLNESYNLTDNKTGDIDGDGIKGSSKDVAKHLYTKLGNFKNTTYPFRINTHVIQLFGELNDLKLTAEYGHGLYYALDSAEQLESILIGLILSLLEADSSYVAPVVPASPESQLYSGERIYLGFFKPMNDEPWYGNIKKFALDRSNRMLGFDTTGDLTIATDEEGNFIVDNTGNPAIHSFWSSDADGGLVDAGGVGEQLFSLFATPPAVPGDRTLLFGSSLTSFTSANLTKEQLAVDTDAERDDLIKFIYGLDAYDEFDGDMRHWIKGDVMHSKPVIMNYSNYDFNLTNEANCGTNKTYIFVGGNDGMLHAYRDCDGKEVWGFIPDEFLADLQYLRDFDHHYYFMDGSPVIYFHDQNKDGTITASEDAVVLIVGMRRGGGKSTLGFGGGDSTYYALNITNPENPEFLWKINNSTSGFAELGQTWSLPTLALMQLGEPKAAKVVAIFGAGYDTNEDLRHGATQDFPDADENTVTSAAFSGEGNLISSTGNGPYAPSGRGCFAVEVASFDASAGKRVVLKSTPTLLWSYTAADDDSDRMKFSFPSDPLVLDRDYDGYADTTYIGDTGGQLWRFDMQSNSTSNWNATCIFAANDGVAEVGRKAFYKPTAT